MKKLLLLATLLGITASAFAQGNVSFRNNASTSYYIYTNSATGSLDGQDPNTRLMSGSNAYRIGLYASPTTGGAAGSLTLVGMTTNSAALAGRFLGPSPFVLPAGYAAGTPITFQIRAWSFAGGLSYEEALLAALVNPLNIAFGVSALGTVTPSANSAPVAVLFGTEAGLLTQGFQIGPVPEPSSIALGLLGLGAMGLFRRKK
jgi:hypothetical protein